MSLLIRNGEIVTAGEHLVGDIWCERETITRIGRELEVTSGAEVIEASGKYVFPGFIDPHVHIYLPVMGTCTKDSHETASKAALVGGTTTLIEMICPAREDEPLEAFETWLAKAQGHCACDFSFHMGVTRCDAGAQRQLTQIVGRGVTSFKVLLAYKGRGGIDDEELCQTLLLARKLGVLTAAHCENADLIECLQRQLLAQGKTGPEWHHESRPPAVEAEGVHHLMTFAKILDVPVYVAHLSCEQALREAEAGRANGATVWIEALVQHLITDKSFAERPDFEGAKYVMSPPLREEKHQQVLWDALRDGRINTISSDHAPFDFATQKRRGEGNFTQIPNGMPGIEDRVNLLFTHGVKRRGLELARFVDVASTQAAKLFGLFPRKGAIQVGSDADLVVYDPAYRGQISARTHLMNVDYNPFEGMEIEGRPSVVTVRGQVVVREGKFVGQTDRGRFLEREPGPKLSEQN